MCDRDITREQSGGRGRYLLRENGAEAALIFGLAAPGRIVAEHTEVAAALRGTGAGLALVARMVQDARAAGARIEARCPFVAAQRDRHPEWVDAFGG